MHQKTSDRSWVFSVLKFGECLWKYSSFIFLTRLESQLNASRWLHVSTLCRGIISCHFELGGPSGVALDMVPLGGKTSTWSGEGCHCLGLGECLGTGGEGAMGVDTHSEEEAPCERLNGWDQCLSHQYLVRSYQYTAEFHRAGSYGGLTGREEVEFTLPLLFDSFFFKVLNGFSMWSVESEPAWEAPWGLCLPDGC